MAGVKNKLRERIQELKNKIDEAEEREQNAKELLKEVGEVVYNHESEVDSKKKKIAQTQKILAQRNKEVNKHVKKLEELQEKMEVENQLVKTLENLELDGDEKLNDLEKQSQKICEIADSKESENKECSLRMAQLENDLDKVIRREDEALEKCEKLQEYIKKATAEMERLKEKEEGTYEREDENDKKLAFLSQELHNMLTSAEEKERVVTNLELYKDKIKAEIRDKQNEIKSKREEMDKLAEMIDDM